MPDPVFPKYYVYVLYRAYGERLPCYVGKGTGSRVKQHERLGASHYNKHLAAILAKCGGTLPYAIVFRSNDEQAAFAEERRLIALYGRTVNRSGCLCNLTDGGEGHSGYVQSVELRGRRSAAMQGNQFGVGNTNRRGKTMSEESLEKMRGNQNCKGKQNSLGYKHTDEWKAANARRMQGNTHTKGRKRTESEIAKMRTSMLGNTHGVGRKQTSAHIAARIAASALTRSKNMLNLTGNNVNPLAVEAWRKSMGIQNG